MSKYTFWHRCGTVNPTPVPPVIDCSMVSITWALVGTAWEYTMQGYTGDIPAGVDGIAWHAGVSDCSEAAGVVALAAMPFQFISVEVPDVDVVIYFAWALGSVEFAAGCECHEIGPLA